GGVDPDRGGGERAVEVPGRGVGRVAGVDEVRLVQAGVVLGQRHVVLRLLVVDRYPPGRLARHLQGLGHRRGHELPAVGDRRRLEQGQLRVVGAGQPRRVVRREDGEHTWQGQGPGGIDGADRAPGDDRRHGPYVHGPVYRVIE